jgi:hypothetical protein
MVGKGINMQAILAVIVELRKAGVREYHGPAGAGGVTIDVVLDPPGPVPVEIPKPTKEELERAENDLRFGSSR